AGREQSPREAAGPSYLESASAVRFGAGDELQPMHARPGAGTQNTRHFVEQRQSLRTNPVFHENRARRHRDLHQTRRIDILDLRQLDAGLEQLAETAVQLRRFVDAFEGAARPDVSGRRAGPGPERFADAGEHLAALRWLEYGDGGQDHEEGEQNQIDTGHEETGRVFGRPGARAFAVRGHGSVEAGEE